jgi:hypothetical protein
MKKIGLLCLALVLVLGSLGFAYAKWSDTVTISKTITTDDVSVIWGTYSDFDPCGSGSLDYNLDLDKLYPVDPELTPPIVTWVRVDKDVGCIEVTGVGTDSVTITVTCAYPLYYGDIEVDLQNTGSVPVKIQSITGTTNGWNIASDAWFEDPADCDGPIWVDLVDGVGTQIDPGDKTAASVEFVVQQCAEQGQTYTFTITWSVVNWNEY